MIIFQDTVKSDNFRKSNQKKRRAYTKTEAKKIRAITLQGAIEKRPILILYEYWKSVELDSIINHYYFAFWGHQ